MDETITEVQSEAPAPKPSEHRGIMPSTDRKDLDALIWETVHFEDDTQPELSGIPQLSRAGRRARR